MDYNSNVGGESMSMPIFTLERRVYKVVDLLTC